MADRTRILRATVLAAPLGVLALGAQAADIASTIKEQQQFSTFAEAMESAGIAQLLQGEGPYTVFAPTDEAFDRLPQGVQDALMKQENQDQLKTLLQYHVIEGKEIMAEDAVGGETEVDTLSGDRLSVDGTGPVIVLMPRQEAPAAQAPGQQEGVETEVAEESGMPASEHQQQVLAEEPATEEQQTAVQGDVPASPHQEQVLRDQPAAEPQAGTAQPQTAEGAAVPASPHQEQVLRGEQTGQQTGQQTGTAQPQTAQDMPASPHQEQVLRNEPATEQQAGQQGMRAATVVEPDIEADNGVIHAVDALLIPPSVLSALESAATSSGGGTGSEWRAGDEPG